MTPPSSRVFDRKCPSRVLLDHVTARWAVLVLVALADGTMRWGELQAKLNGVTHKVLAETLRRLEGDHLVRRETFAEVPPRVEYSLTEHGRKLNERLLPLVYWIETYASDLGESRCPGAS